MSTSVEKQHGARHAIMHVRWRGEPATDVCVDLPRPRAEAIRYPEPVIARVRDLAQRYGVRLPSKPSITSARGYFLLGKCSPKRKNWYFCYDKVGARASANLFSLVMTCRENKVDRFEYLSYIFEHLPTATSVEALEAQLPWNVKPVLEERRTRREAAPHSAGTT